MSDFTLFVLGMAGGAALALGAGYLALVYYFSRERP